MESNPNLLQFNEARRQSPAAILLILANYFRRLARQIWPLVILLFFRKGEHEWMAYVLYFAIATTIFSMFASIIAYWRFYFYTTEEEFVIERGFLNKVKLSVPFDRIQTINFQRNILHRFLGVVGVEIDTAGSQSKEMSIIALTEEEATLVRQFLLEKRGNPLIKSSAEPAANHISISEEVLLLQLDILDLLKIGFSQNHLRTVGIILAFLFGLYEFAEDILGDVANKQAEAFGVWLLNSFSTFLMAVVPLLLIAAFFLSLIRTTLRYYNLRFFHSAAGYRVVSGLFTEQERNASFAKIQLVQWQNNPIYRLFGMYALRLKQASSATVQDRQAINVPGAYDRQVGVVRNAYFPGGDDQLLFWEHGIHRAIVGRYLLYFGVWPAIGFIVLSLNSFGLQAFLWLLLIPIVWTISRIYYRSWVVALHPKGCMLKHGIWNTHHTVLQWYKIQAVELRQSPYQRRHQLANLYLYTAAGGVSIPYFPLDKAVALKDYILFQVETDRRKWM